MKSKDILEQKRKERAQKLNEAIATNDPEAVAQAMAEMAESIQEDVLEAAQHITNVEQMDVQALTARGLRQLTSAEKKYYESLISAMRSGDLKQALNNLDVTMPETIIESVFEDIQNEHPLLNQITFQNTTGVIKWILNKNGKQKAKWGSLTAEFTKELEGDFEEFDTTLYSLMAFLPVHKSMLDLGATWLDAYVRAVIKEANAVGLEEGIIAGTGVDMPIGMMKDIEASHKDGEPYPDKEAIPVMSFTPTEYGAIVARLAVSRNGMPRKVGSLLMVVNPVDYFTKVMPATTMQRPDGTYANNVLPYPTTIEQCTEVPQGKAVIGIAANYFMGLGASSKDGVIQYDDSVRFMQNQRIYASYLYGNGKPTDNNSFLVLDISNLKPASYTVRIVQDESGINSMSLSDESGINSMSLSDESDINTSASYTETSLNALTVAKIEEIAQQRGYTLEGSNKADKIASFLEQQNAAE